MNNDEKNSSGVTPQKFEVSIPNASMRRDGKGRTHTVFHIHVAVKDASKDAKLHDWETIRRFSQFDRVNKLLHTCFPNVKLPSLPPKKWIGSLEIDFVDKRRLSLEKYLRLVEIAEVRESAELIAFLQNTEYPGDPRTPERSFFTPTRRGSVGGDDVPASLSFGVSLHSALYKMAKRIEDLEARCSMNERTAKAALRIAHLAAGSLTLEAKRKLQRKVRDELKNLSDKRGSTGVRSKGIDDSDKEKQEGYGFGNGFGRSTSLAGLARLGKSITIDSESDSQKRISSSLDRKRLKRRSLGSYNIWGQSSSKSSKDRETSDTFERFLRFTSANSSKPPMPKYASGQPKLSPSPRLQVSPLALASADIRSKTPPLESVLNGSTPTSPVLTTKWGVIGSSSRKKGIDPLDSCRKTRASSDGLLDPRKKRAQSAGLLDIGVFDKSGFILRETEPKDRESEALLKPRAEVAEFSHGSGTVKSGNSCNGTLESKTAKSNGSSQLANDTDTLSVKKDINAKGSTESKFHNKTIPIIPVRNIEIEKSKSKNSIDLHNNLPSSSNKINNLKMDPRLVWMENSLVKQMEQVLSHVLPQPQLMIRRQQALDFITDLIRRTLSAQVYSHGSFSLRTDLPDSDVDVSAYFSRGQSSTWVQRVVNALCQTANVADIPRHLKVRSVTFVNAEVPIVKTMVGRIPVDISGNQIGALEALGLFEACDRIIGKDHLLKKTVILFKTWAKNEAGIFGAKDGMLNAFCLRTIVLFVFNAFGSRIKNAVQGLFEIFMYLKDFPWETMALGLYGPIYLSHLPSLIPVSDSQWAWPENTTPMFLYSSLQRYSMLSRPRSKVARTAKVKERMTPSTVNFSQNVQQVDAKRSSTDPKEVENAKLVLIPSMMTVIDPTNPFNNIARSVSGYKSFRVIQKQLNSAAKTMRLAAQEWEKDTMRKSHFLTGVLFMNTMNRYRAGKWMRSVNAITDVKSPGRGDSKSHRSDITTDTYTETELSNLSGAENFIQEPYVTDLTTIQERLAHARQFEAPAISEEELVALVVVLLDHHGSVPIGKMGSMLHNATNNHSLPAMIKSRYGGLKRFLLSHAQDFRVGMEHPFNPPVELLHAPSKRQRSLVQEILKLSGGSLNNTNNSKLPPKPSNLNNRRDRGSRNQQSGRRNNGPRRNDSPSSVKVEGVPQQFVAILEDQGGCVREAEVWDKESGRHDECKLEGLLYDRQP
eukprot:CAMPEP_0167770708 /NCGR_PEP_ID=MMETSP0110_2-20121227/18088_1 /TAXON_ID=629695 /ORGANISM="Gymnochlora sp., Strain CCMP2014" /LENGTH=1213 /DNA_ID=CAMNT_0007659953 /DNA_START=59 /DNA_END=3704 /DNA_ORIENTATION=+